MSSFDAASLLTPRITAAFGDRGKRWLISLPTLLEQTAERLGLRLLPPYPNLTYNYVAPALDADGREVVLKLGVPNKELTSEIEALRIFGGAGCAQVLDSDPQAGILVLERLLPGTPLTPLANDHSDSEATSIACTVMRGLHNPVQVNEIEIRKFQSVSELGLGFQRLRSEFGGGVGPFPRNLVEEAERLWSDLDASAQAFTLLHGDLHHDNIISATRSPWLAIDPKGYIGDPAFETCALLRNLWRDRKHVTDPARTIERRVNQMAEEMEYDLDRVRGWGLAQAVLSVWWSYEDGDSDWADSLEIAEIIRGVRC
jgi:streptomycin 6-kinase